MMRTLALVLESAFKNLDRRIEERWNAGNLSHGFWRTGVIPKLTPVDTMREYGFWQGKAVLENGLAGQVSVALIGGHTRMGIFLPNRLLEGVPLAGCNSTWGESLTDAVAKAHDGQPAPIVRRVGGDTLFDHIFTEPPFSAEWLLRCTQDSCAQDSHSARDILENHLAWRVIDLWESALRTVMSRQTNDLGIVVHSAKPLPPILTETMPLTLQDSYEIQSGRWVTIVTATDALDLTGLEAQLQNLLPDHGITIQKDAP
ncbi:protein of unknown function [Acidithiobacillus ferrivorans]|uniref:Uncharacterized protein n=1 Tax=Acidithiobacillus ferrivorans TaxID=160808 RepID=A0A060UZJ5_9PROT|nr:hypothetical protein [Acidithiobacillus ferrivorans]CDQ12063.1 conserved hypothetical protein [Acidithiobacillus ferrivorans]SMH64810.1 protein of unknown function [Acidithiobacillus ferrivorans]